MKAIHFFGGSFVGSWWGAQVEFADWPNRVLAERIGDVQQREDVEDRRLFLGVVDCLFAAAQDRLQLATGEPAGGFEVENDLLNGCLVGALRGTPE
jgi:hypothetical protein